MSNYTPYRRTWKEGIQDYFDRAWERGQTALWSIQFILALFAAIGMFFLARVPPLAKKYQVEQPDLVLRAIEQHDHDPYYLLDRTAHFMDAIALVGLPIANPENAGAIVATRQGPFQYQLEIFEHTDNPNQQRGRLLQTLASTTPHTMIPEAELVEARAAMDKLYPPEDREARTALINWGQKLFQKWWAEQGYHWSRPALVIEPNAGTEEEHLWFAWRYLTGGDKSTQTDLPQLGLLVRQTYPDEMDYLNALAWAENLHALQKARFDHYQRRAGQLKYESKYHKVPGDLPPSTNQTFWWLLYHYVGLSESSRQVAQDRWLSFLGRHKRDAAIRWGRQLETERRANREPLPPSSDEVALLCAMEKLTGTDGYGNRCRTGAADLYDSLLFQNPTLNESLGPSLGTFVEIALAFNYPNDDTFYVLGAGDPFRIFTEKPNEGRWVMPLVALAIAGGFRLIILYVFGLLVLRLGNNERYLAYERAQTRLTWSGVFFSYLLAPLLSWAYTLWTLTPEQELITRTPYDALAGVYATVICGGTVILSLNRIIALVMIRLGQDINRAWFDEVLGAVLGGALLWYFGNSPGSVASYILFAVAPEIVRRLRARRKPVYG